MTTENTPAVKADKVELTPANVVETYPIESLVTLKGRRAFEIYSNIELLKPYIEYVRQESTSILYDMTKKKDRDACGSNARKVSSTKTALTSAIADSVKAEQARVKAAQEGKRFVETELSNIRDEVLAPRKAWQEEQDRIEAARVNAINERINNISDIGNLRGNESKEEIGSLIEALDAMPIDESFEEFSGKANEAKAEALKTLNDKLLDIIEFEQAEERRKQLEEQERKAQLALEAEKKKNKIEKIINALRMTPMDYMGKKSSVIQDKIDKVKAYEPTVEEFEDRHDEAVQAKAQVVQQLEMMFQQAQHTENLQAEQDRREEEERQRVAAEQAAKAAEEAAKAAAEAEAAKLQETGIAEQAPVQQAPTRVLGSTDNMHDRVNNIREVPKTGHFKDTQPADPHAKQAAKAADEFVRLTGMDYKNAQTLVTFIRSNMIPFVKFEA